MKRCSHRHVLSGITYFIRVQYFQIKISTGCEYAGSILRKYVFRSIFFPFSYWLILPSVNGRIVTSKRHNEMEAHILHSTFPQAQMVIICDIYIQIPRKKKYKSCRHDVHRYACPLITSFAFENWHVWLPETASGTAITVLMAVSHAQKSWVTLILSIKWITLITVFFFRSTGKR